MKFANEIKVDFRFLSIYIFFLFKDIFTRTLKNKYTGQYMIFDS